MNCQKKILEGNLSFYSRISATINSLLLIINICQIITILNIFINVKIIILFLISKNIYYYLLLFYVINIIIIIILEYFRNKNILFQSKKYFSIIISYLIATINIILISILFPNLFVNFKELNLKNNILYKRYNIILIIKLFFNLSFFIINILIFKSYIYFTQENRDNNFDCKSFNSNSTYEDEIIINDDINIYNENKMIIQKNILDKLTIPFINEYTQTN